VPRGGTEALIARSALRQKAALSMPTGKIPRRREAAPGAVTTLAVPMGSLPRLTSVSRGEGAYAVVLASEVPHAFLRGMET
jgi:hypothetical protein